MVEFAGMWRARISRLARLAFFIFLGLLVMASSTQPAPDPVDRAHAYTRPVEFDYAGWILNALWTKLNQASLGSENYLPQERRKALVLEYLGLVARGQQLEARLRDTLADPNLADPQAAAAGVRRELDGVRARRGQLEPAAEAILQDQVAAVVADQGLTLGGQPLPPVLYHSTPLPLALIISPRDAIRQEADISLAPDYPVDRFDGLEQQVDQALDMSSLVVNIGGVGVYPTMVYQTPDLSWLSEVVAHEWIHNFLTLRPLGISYMESPELRTMNETTAAIAGKEIGRIVLERYYPELAPPPQPAPAAPQAPQPTPEPPAFDFTAEMRLTRVEVDRLLAAGQVAQAEDYMEQRRKVFWDNGYHLRKINQAYFAFHGAYADQPGGGAAGEDPVGAAVRALRAQSPTLAAFVKRIAWMTSFEQLRQAVAP